MAHAKVGVPPPQPKVRPDWLINLILSVAVPGMFLFWWVQKSYDLTFNRKDYRTRYPSRPSQWQQYLGWTITGIAHVASIVIVFCQWLTSPSFPWWMWGFEGLLVFFYIVITLSPPNTD